MPATQQHKHHQQYQLPVRGVRRPGGGRLSARRSEAVPGRSQRHLPRTGRVPRRVLTLPGRVPRVRDVPDLLRLLLPRDELEGEPN